MKTRAWPDSWPTNTVGSGGGLVEEREAVQEERLETLGVGPGEAARQEVAVGKSGPAPSRWTLRTLRVSVEGLPGYPLSGGWRVRQAWGLGGPASCARLFSPALDSRGKVRRLPRCLRAAARHPDTGVALFVDDFGYQRGPAVAPTWGREAAGAQRAGNNQQWRTIGALNALTGQVNSLAGYLVGRQPVSAVSTPLAHVYPVAARLYVIPDNGTIHPHPDVRTALERYPRINPVWLPTSAPGLTPLEKLWRWLRHDGLKMPRWVEAWPRVKQRVHDFVDQFAHGAPDLLRYVGLVGKGTLATVINTS
jgi:hypothetical protein